MRRLFRVVDAFSRRSPAHACLALATALLLLAGVVALASVGDEDDTVEVLTGDDESSRLPFVTLPPTTLPVTTSSTLATATPAATVRPPRTPSVTRPVTTAPMAPPPTSPFGSIDTVATPGLYVIDADGTRLRRLAAKSGFAPVWSPDGSRIAYSSDGAMVVVHVADGRTVRLPDALTASPPAWSPDGTRLAYATGDGVTRDVTVVAADGSGAPFTMKTAESESSVAWASTGRLAAMGFDGIFAFDADGSNRAHVYREDLNYGPIGWSPDGSHLFALPDGLALDLVMEADGSDPRQIGGVDPQESSLWQADWAPDGRRLVWWENARRTGSTLLHVGPSDGTPGREIAKLVDYPDWSPAGDAILGTRAVAAGYDGEIVTLATDGSGLRVVFSGARVSRPAWSPDGRTIAFVGHPAA